MRWSCMLLLLLATPAFADDELDVPGVEATNLRGDALVWEDAVFFLEPWESGSNIQFRSALGRARREEVGRAIPVRIVDSTMRNFVEVEVHGRADCTWRRLDLDKRIEGLRLFVRRDDLAPVLAKPFALQFSDGTRVKLAPGVPVMPTLAGDYLVAAKNDRLRLPIPHTSVGYLYKPGKIAEPETPAGKYVRVDRMVNARLGEESIPVRSNWIAPAPDKKADTALLHWQTRCLDMVVQVPATALRPTEPTKPSVASSTTLSTRSLARIPSGAPLATRSGREIAIAAAPIDVGVPTGETACFDAKFSLAREDEAYQSVAKSFTLCAPAALVER